MVRSDEGQLSKHRVFLEVVNEGFGMAWGWSRGGSFAAEHKEAKQEKEEVGG